MLVRSAAVVSGLCPGLTPSVPGHLDSWIPFGRSRQAPIIPGHCRQARRASLATLLTGVTHSSEKAFGDGARDACRAGGSGSLGGHKRTIDQQVDLLRQFDRTIA